MSNLHEPSRRVLEGSSLSLDSRKGLELLLQAYAVAEEVGRDVWDFALEISVLLNAHLSLNDVRWLVCKGYASLARETTTADDACRSFQFQTHLALRKRSCVVLTAAGAAFIGRSIDSLHAENSQAGNRHDASSKMGDSQYWPSTSNYGLGKAATPNGSAWTPCWDCDRQELRLGLQVVKEFKLHSPNQTIILTAFQEENWPPRIDDPLPPSEIDPKQRLHDTIKSLNRNQKTHLIRFRGDGTGQGVRWQLAPSASKSSGRASDRSDGRFAGDDSPGGADADGAVVPPENSRRRPSPNPPFVAT